jgi:hypothetical protein
LAPACRGRCRWPGSTGSPPRPRRGLPRVAGSPAGFAAAGLPAAPSGSRDRPCGRARACPASRCEPGRALRVNRRTAARFALPGGRSAEAVAVAQRIVRASERLSRDHRMGSGGGFVRKRRLRLRRRISLDAGFSCASDRTFFWPEQLPTLRGPRRDATAVVDGRSSECSPSRACGSAKPLRCAGATSTSPAANWSSGDPRPRPASASSSYPRRWSRRSSSGRRGRASPLRGDLVFGTSQGNHDGRSNVTRRLLRTVIEAANVELAKAGITPIGRSRCTDSGAAPRSSRRRPARLHPRRPASSDTRTRRSRPASTWSP